MQFHKTALAFVLIAAGVPAAFAGTASGSGEMPYETPTFHGQLTRAQVQQELQTARSGSSIASGELGYESAPVHGHLARAHVQQDLRAALDAGDQLASGESGYVSHEHVYVTREGQSRHADRFPPAASLGNSR